VKTQPLRCIVGEGALVRKRDLPLLVGINLANKTGRNERRCHLQWLWCFVWPS